MTNKRVPLTNSAITCAKRCLRQYYLRYNLGLRHIKEAQPLRMGSAVHKGIELWNRNEYKPYAIQVALSGYEVCPEWADEYKWLIECATVGALITGYFWYYGNDALVYSEIEKPWSMPLANPQTGRASRTFYLAGKRDAIVMDGDRCMVMEHKTTSEDISQDADYWQGLRNDPQISAYMISAMHDGYDPACMLYNVIRKPTIKPRGIPILDDDGLKIVYDTKSSFDGNAKRVFNKNGTPKQAACKGTFLHARPETSKEFGDRLLADIESKPEFYYQRREVPRLECDLINHQANVWQFSKLLMFCNRENVWPKCDDNFKVGRCRRCEYKAICDSPVAIEPGVVPDGYKIIEDVNPELEGSKDERTTTEATAEAAAKSTIEAASTA